MTQTSILGPLKDSQRLPRELTAWTDPVECCNTDWEEAYRRFETPEEEISKFTKRLNSLGQHAWPRDAHNMS